MENQTLKNNVRFFRCSTKIERSRREGLFNIDSYWTSVVYVRSVGMLGLMIYALIFDIEYPSRTPIGIRLVVLALPAILETAGLVGLLKRKPYLLTGPILIHIAMMATVLNQEIEGFVLWRLLAVSFCACLYLREMVRMRKSSAQKWDHDSLKEIKTEK